MSRSAPDKNKRAKRRSVPFSHFRFFYLKMFGIYFDFADLFKADAPELCLLSFVSVI